MIRYTNSLEGIDSSCLVGFFQGWPNPPTSDAHLKILQGSSHIELAIDEEGMVIGFLTAISDGISCGYIPHLEVLPVFQGKGIGSTLVRRAVDHFRQLYMLDLMCDENVRPFYERLGFRDARGMVMRNYERQSCDTP